MVMGVIMLREMFLAVAILFLTSGVFTNAQKSAETVVSVGLGAPLTVECGLRVEQRAEWLLNGSAVPVDMRAAGEQAGAGEARLTARLHAAHARAHHAGLYTCSREPGAPRVRVHVTRAAPGAPAAAPSAPAAEPPRSARAGAAEEESATGFPILYFDLHRNLTLNCTSADADKAATYEWKKNELPLEQVPQLKDRFKLDEGGAVFTLKAKTNEEDFGNYTCALAGGAQPRGWEVRARPLARLPANTNVVEGQKLKLQCKIIGKPYPRITWTYAASEDDNASRPLPGEGEGGDRWRLETSEQGVAEAALVLAAAERGDAGVYACHAAGGSSDRTTLRVKDMYAALWPFLGICAEVFVLCAIILVYEKRRTKPELEDSDTDNHEQKKS